MDWLASAAAERPEAPALITPDGVVSYRDLDRAADVVATIVVGSGLEGGVVAFWGERDPATVAALWGIPRAGATAVPVDSRWPPAEAMALTARVGARGLWAVPDGGIARLLERRAATDLPGAGPPHPDARFILFTSGSEGRHKPVILTSANIEASVAGSRARLGNGPDDPWLAVLPLFHVGGMSIAWRQAEAGAPMLLEPRFDPARVTRLLADQTAYASLVPTMLRRVLDAGASGAALKAALIGGGPTDAALLQRALDAGIPALQTYGMTETTSQLCTVAPDRARADLGTAGTPLPGAEVRIVDGRIEVRGPMVSHGYLGDPPRAEGEWFTTGDLGSIDDQGRLVVGGRADSVIVSGGENVSPEAVASVLRRHPGVVDARVFGIPDDEWGRRVVAEVVLEGTTVAEVEEWARGALRAAELPREWRPVGSLSAKLG